MGMLLLIALMNGFTKIWVDGAIESGLGHVQLRPSGYREKRGQKMLFADPDGLIQITQEIEQQLAAISTEIPGIRYAHRFEREGFLRLGSAIQGVQVIGVDVDREKNISKFDDWLITGSYFASSRAEEERDKLYGLVPCLLGRANAEKFEVERGETLVLSINTAEASTRSVRVRVEGIFQAIAEPVEKYTLLLPRQALSLMFNESPNQISYSIYLTSHLQLAKTLQKKIENMIENTMENTMESTMGNTIENTMENTMGNTMGNTIENTMEKGAQAAAIDVLSYQELQPGITKLLENVENTIAIFYFIMLSGFAFVLLNSVTMSVFERTREIGILRAIGSPGYFVFLMVIFESLLLGLLGALAGCFISGVLVFVLGQTGISFEIFAKGLERMGGIGARVYPALKLSDYYTACQVAIVISLLASIYPAYKAIKVTPIKAIYNR